MSKKNKLSALSIVTLFFLALFTPLVGGIIQEDQALSLNEKRKLHQQPDFPVRFSEIAPYIANFEEYYNDHFGFREWFLKGYGEVKKILGDHDIGKSAANVGTSNTIKGKDGWYFLNRKWDGDPVSDYRNIDLYEEAELLRSVLYFAARADWLKRRGIEYLFFFAPNKHTIYSEYLPDYITKIGKISAMDQLYDAMQRYTNVNFVDLRKVLLDSKQKAATYWKENKDMAALYYKMDSHWNGAGADIAQYEIASRIEELFPGSITPTNRSAEDFEMIRFAGDITLIMGRKDEEAFGPNLPGSACLNDTFSDYLQRYHSTVCKRNSLDAILFNDSFMPPLKPFFTDYFRHATYIWESMTLKRINHELENKKPHIIIEQRAERFLPFTPNAYDEEYTDFWQQHWGKWKKRVFQLKNDEAHEKLKTAEEVEIWYSMEEEAVAIKGKTDNLLITIPNIPFQTNILYLVRISLQSDRETTLQMLYSSSQMGEFPSMKQRVTGTVRKGENEIFIPLFSLTLGDRLGIGIDDPNGYYLLKQFEIKELTFVKLQ